MAARPTLEPLSKVPKGTTIDLLAKSDDETFAVGEGVAGHEAAGPVLGAQRAIDPLDGAGVCWIDSALRARRWLNSEASCQSARGAESSNASGAAKPATR